MIKPVTFQGVGNFNANLYALEVASRFLDYTNANGYYKDYGSELAATADGATVTIGTGALVVQGRMVEISAAETVELESPVDGEVGYVCLRIETYHPSDVENCTLVIYTGSALSAVDAALTQEDVFSADSNSENLVYECPLYSFAVSGSNITNLTLVLGAVESAVQTAAEAKTAAETAVKTANAAAEDVEKLSEQVGESLGTTIYKDGTALSSLDYDDIASKDTIKQAIFQESFTPDLNVGYGLSGLSSYSSTGTLNDGDSVFAVWFNTETSVNYVGIGDVYSIDTDLCIEFTSLYTLSSASSSSGSGGSSTTYEDLSVSPSTIQVENSTGSSGGGSGTITISGGSGSYSVAASSGVSGYFTVLTVSGSTVSYTYYVASTASSNTIYGTITITDTVTCNTIDVDVTCYEYSCLTGDTLITLADGTRKRIDSIEVTDRILSIDPDTGEFVADTIISTDSKEKKLGHHYDKYVFSDGTVITTIHRHRFYNVTQQQMVHLDTWNIGDKAYKQDGTLIELTEKHIKIEEKEQYHYSLFTVHHNYFANGVLCGDRFTRQITKGV